MTNYEFQRVWQGFRSQVKIEDEIWRVFVEGDMEGVMTMIIYSFNGFKLYLIGRPWLRGGGEGLSENSRSGVTSYPRQQFVGSWIECWDTEDLIPKVKAVLEEIKVHDALNAGDKIYA